MRAEWDHSGVFGVSGNPNFNLRFGHSEVEVTDAITGDLPMMLVHSVIATCSDAPIVPDVDRSLPLITRARQDCPRLNTPRTSPPTPMPGPTPLITLPPTPAPPLDLAPMDDQSGGPPVGIIVGGVLAFLAVCVAGGVAYVTVSRKYRRDRIERDLALSKSAQLSMHHG